MGRQTGWLVSLPTMILTITGQRARLVLPALAAALLLGAAVPATGAAKVTCGGKKADIVKGVRRRQDQGHQRR